MIYFCPPCRIDIDLLYVRMGEYNIATEDEPLDYLERKVKNPITHHKYHQDNDYDIALLKLDEPILFQANIMPICLPEDDNRFVGKMGWVTGWGNLGKSLFCNIKNSSTD